MTKSLSKSMILVVLLWLSSLKATTAFQPIHTFQLLTKQTFPEASIPAIQEGTVAGKADKEAPAVTDQATFEDAHELALLAAEWKSNTTLYNLLSTQTSVKVDGSRGLQIEIDEVKQACICASFRCEELVAMIPFGVQAIDLGYNTGRSPLLLFGPDGRPIPCLGLLSVPHDQLAVSGCDLVEYPSSPNEPIRVQNCIDGTIESFRLVDPKNTSRIIARALRGWELIPNNARSNMVSPSMTVTAFLEAFFQVGTAIVEFNDEVTINVFGFRFTFPISVETDISDILESVGTQLLTDTVNGIFAFWLPDDFSEERPAAEATVNDLMRILMSFSLYRLFLAKTTSTTTETLASSALYRTLTNEGVPEMSTKAETLSQFALLWLTVIVFGSAIGRFFRQFCDTRRGRIAITKCRLFFYFVGALLASMALAAELTSLYYNWELYKERMDYSEIMIRINAAGGNFMAGVAPFRVGEDGDPRLVTFTIVRITDASNDTLWLFVLGTIAAFVALVVAVVAGYYGLDDDEDDNANRDTDDEILALRYEAGVPLASTVESDKDEEEEEEEEEVVVAEV